MMRNFFLLEVVLMLLASSCHSMSVDPATVPPVSAIPLEEKNEVKKLDLSSQHPLNDFFKQKKNNDFQSAVRTIESLKPSDQVEEFYYNYFKTLVMTDRNEKMTNLWVLYSHLKKSKKLFRLQLEVVNAYIDEVLAADPTHKEVADQITFRKEAKNLLKRVKGLPEGLDFELKYLKWIVKHNITYELCKNERQRWLAQTNVSLKEVSEGLKSCPLKLDDFIYRTRMLVFSGAEKKAQDELKEFIEAKTELKEWEKAYLQAVYFTNVGDPLSAFEIVKKYEADILNSEDYHDNLFYIAQRAGELTKAEELVNKIIEKAKFAKQKKEYVFQKAFLFYQTKRYTEAIKIFDELIKEHPTRKRKSKNIDFDDLTWLRAWCHYLNKDYEKAKSYFTENKEWTRDKTRNLYWLAQSEWALNNQLKALEYYRQLAIPLIEGKFFNYYNYLSWLRYETRKGEVSNEVLKNQLSLMKSGRGFFMMPDGNVNPNKIIDEYKMYFDEITVTDEGDIQVVNQDAVIAGQSETEAIKIETSAQLKKEVVWADHLLDWGYPDLAKWHLYDVEKSIKTRKNAEPLIQYYLDKRFYYRALSLMQKVSTTQDRKISLRDDELLWKAIYPRAYELNVKSEALIRKVDPYLVWSIMKAETQFKADAISPVGAVGLMQFMPYTSQKVAQLLKESDHNPRTLFQPEVAIQHGAMYLKKLGKEFDSQLPLVAAAYNGGPHRVKLWLRNLGDIDLDVFIEHIPFSETRTYVKRVLSFMKAYQKIYEEKSDYKKYQWLIEKNNYKLVEPISLKEEWDFNGSTMN